MAKMIRNTFWTIGILSILGLVGCGADSVNGMLDTNTVAVEAIRSDVMLMLEEKRDEFVVLGISQLIINGLLRDQWLGNQYGGDLTSAFNKVVDGQFST